MRDDDMSQEGDGSGSDRDGMTTAAMFGDYAVISPGVQIILQGRQVSSTLDR